MRSSAVHAPTCSRDLGHWESILHAMSFELFGQTVAQLRSQAIELLSLGRMIERQGASFHGIISILISDRGQSQPIRSKARLPGCTFRTALFRRVVPFLDPLEQERVGTLRRHCLQGHQSNYSQWAQSSINLEEVARGALTFTLWRATGCTPANHVDLQYDRDLTARSRDMMNICLHPNIKASIGTVVSSTRLYGPSLRQLLVHDPCYNFL